MIDNANIVLLNIFKKNGIEDIKQNHSMKSNTWQITAWEYLVSTEHNHTKVIRTIKLVLPRHHADNDLKQNQPAQLFKCQNLSRDCIPRAKQLFGRCWRRLNCTTIQLTSFNLLYNFGCNLKYKEHMLVTKNVVFLHSRYRHKITRNAYNGLFLYRN